MQFFHLLALALSAGTAVTALPVASSNSKMARHESDAEIDRRHYLIGYKVNGEEEWVPEKRDATIAEKRHYLIGYKVNGEEEWVPEKRDINAAEKRHYLIGYKVNGEEEWVPEKRGDTAPEKRHSEEDSTVE